MMNPTQTAIINRCQDLELSVSFGPGGPIDKALRQLNHLEVHQLGDELGYLGRGEPDFTIRRRYREALDAIVRDLERRARLSEKDRIQQLALTAKSEKRETCQCGAKHTPGAKYYVTAVDGKKTIPLSGPYPTHAEAVAMVDEMKELAIKLDPKAAFASFGTAAMKSSYRKKGVLDSYR